MLKYDYEEGNRGTFVFVHGAGGTRHKWRKIMAGLPDGYGGLAINLPGHGESGGKALNSVEAYAQAILDCVGQINPVRPLIWTGHSLGGAIVQMAALLDANMVDSLVLVGTGGRLRVLPELLENLQNGVIDPVGKRRSFSPSAPEELIQAELEADLKIPAEVAYQDYLACDKFDIMDRLADIEKPVQIIVGADDMSTPVKYSEFLLKKLPQAQMKVIAQAGHMVALEQPEAVLACIKEFLAEG